MNTSWHSVLRQDVQQAFRSLVRAPGFTLIAVATLGLAIGVNAGIFSVVDTVLLDPLPFNDTDRLVYIAASAPGSDMPEASSRRRRSSSSSTREKSELLEDVATYNSFTSTLRAGDRIERVRMSAPTTSLFSTLGVEPILGRLPVPEDEDRVVVISHALWTTWFGADPAILERTRLRVRRRPPGDRRDGARLLVPRTTARLLWIPADLRTEEIEPGRFGQRLVARMAPGARREALAAELTTLARRAAGALRRLGQLRRLIEQHRAVVRPLEEQLLGAVSGPLWILLGSMAIVLIIACANAANLFMVRAERRQPDVAVGSPSAPAAAD